MAVFSSSNLLDRKWIYATSTNMMINARWHMEHLLTFIQHQNDYQIVERLGVGADAGYTF